MNILRVFPTMIGVEKNTDHNALESSLAPRCFEIEKNVISGGHQWLAKSTYTTDGVHNIVKDESFNELNSYVVRCVKAFTTETLKIDYDNLTCHEGWINIARKGNFQEYHSHNPAFLSVIYYLKVPENSAKLWIKNHLADMHRPALTETDMDNGPTIWIKPEPGTLVMFRGHLEHYVEEHPVDDSRISVAYNFYYTPRL